ELRVARVDRLERHGEGGPAGLFPDCGEIGHRMSPPGGLRPDAVPGDLAARADPAQCWPSGMATSRPSIASVTRIWHPRREVGRKSSAKLSMSSSDWLRSPVRADHGSSM